MDLIWINGDWVYSYILCSIEYPQPQETVIHGRQSQSVRKVHFQIRMANDSICRALKKDKSKYTILFKTVPTFTSRWKSSKLSCQSIWICTYIFVQPEDHLHNSIRSSYNSWFESCKRPRKDRLTATIEGCNLVIRSVNHLRALCRPPLDLTAQRLRTCSLRVTPNIAENIQLLNNEQTDARPHYRDRIGYRQKRRLLNQTTSELSICRIGPLPPEK